MAPILSLIPPQLETLCEMYPQAVGMTVALETFQKEMQRFARKVARAKPSQLLLMRLLFYLILNPDREVTADQLCKHFPDVSPHTLRRHLARLRKSPILVATIKKGRWGVPGSRPGEAGRPPWTYVLNPLVVGDCIMSDYVENEHRRFLSLAEKFLTTTQAISEACTRTIAVCLSIAPKLPALAKAARKIPEIDRLLIKRGYQEAPPWLDKLISLIPEELAAAAILRMRIPIGLEDLPNQEVFRLGGSLRGCASLSWRVGGG
jgi:hypothetical protein